MALEFLTPPGVAGSGIAARPLIGVFDSGVGGLSVLGAMASRLPATPMIYVADSGHAPYGDRHDDHVMQRTLRLSQYLVDHGARLLVIACNTATAAAIAMVRERWPQLAVVGVEPGIKPATQVTRNGRIGVMATPATLRSDKFVRLMQRHAVDAELVLQPCPGLAKAIEGGEADSSTAEALMSAYCEPLRAAGVDTVVLGCTHYAFVKPALQALLGAGVTIIDTADAVARHAASVYQTRVTTRTMPKNDSAGRMEFDAASTVGAPVLSLLTTGEASGLTEMARRWLAPGLTAVAMPDL